jgi:hypothetical protein
MKQDAGDSLSRLRDRAPGRAAPEDRAAALLRGLHPCDEPSESQMARIEGRAFGHVLLIVRDHPSPFVWPLLYSRWWLVSPA